MSRRDTILETHGFRLSLLGDLDGDGDVDLEDFSKLQGGFGTIYTLADFGRLKADIGRRPVPSLVHGSGNILRNHPDKRLKAVYTVDIQNPRPQGYTGWLDRTYRTVDEVRALAVKYKERYDAKILLLDNERGSADMEDWIAQCKLFAEMCDAVRDIGISPGMCSAAPWCESVKRSWKIAAADANAVASEFLIPHVDWLGFEMYGSNPSRLTDWLDTFKELNWDCCIAPYLNPIRFSDGARWSTLGEYETMLKIAHAKADITVLWTSTFDALWGKGIGSRWLYDIVAFREWSLGGIPDWLEIKWQ